MLVGESCDNPDVINAKPHVNLLSYVGLVMIMVELCMTFMGCSCLVLEWGHVFDDHAHLFFLLLICFCLVVVLAHATFASPHLKPLKLPWQG